jgi:hypothetical protein
MCGGSCFVVMVALIVAVGRGRAAEVRWVEGEVIVKFKAQATGPRVRPRITRSVP